MLSSYSVIFRNSRPSNRSTPPNAGPSTSWGQPGELQKQPMSGPTVAGEVAPTGGSSVRSETRLRQGRPATRRVATPRRSIKTCRPGRSHAFVRQLGFNVRRGEGGSPDAQLERADSAFAVLRRAVASGRPGRQEQRTVGGDSLGLAWRAVPQPVRADIRLAVVGPRPGSSPLPRPEDSDPP